MTPYNGIGNNPAIYVDNYGEDIVYFDSEGNETKREKSDTEFKVFVEELVYKEVKFLGFAFHFWTEEYVEVPMPNVIKEKDGSNTTGPIYQEYDYLIAAETYLFNSSMEGAGISHTNGLLPDDPASIPDLDPTVVKAIIMQESAMGTNSGGTGTGKSDIMQSNVKGDWDASKSRYVTKGGPTTPQESIRCGIWWLYTKGLTSSQSDGGYKTEWTGGNDWMNAVDNYNGGGTSGYRNSVQNMIYNSLIPKPENYVESPANGSGNSSTTINGTSSADKPRAKGTEGTPFPNP